MRTRVSAAIAACVVAIASETHAQGVALSRFEPAPRGSRFFFADSLDLGRPDPTDQRPLVAAGVAIGWASRLNTWSSRREGRRNTLVRTMIELHPSASVAFAPGARLSLSVPVVAHQQGESTNLARQRFLEPLAPALGDIRGGFDLRFFGPPAREISGVTLAGGVDAWLATGSSAAYASDDFTRFGVHFTAAGRTRWLVYSARAGYMYRRDAVLGGSRVGPEVNAVLGVGAMFRKMTIGPELVASSVIDSGFAQRTTPVEVVLGAHNDVGPVRVGGGVGVALVPGMGAANVRSVFTLEWIGPDVLVLRDRDRDGVPDAEDLCPELPGMAALQGCPRSPDPEVVPTP